jgi:N-acetylmuramoyl-L-alanine amidase
LRLPADRVKFGRKRFRTLSLNFRSTFMRLGTAFGLLAATFWWVGGCSDERPALPPMPIADGPLDLNVVYPEADELISTPDSNWVMGSVGHGRAWVTVNGRTARVFPNGSFLAFLAVPPAGEARYDIAAWLDADTVRTTVPIRRPLAFRSGAPVALAVDAGTLTPSDSMVLRDNEPVTVSVRAPADVEAWLRLPGGSQRRPLRNTRADPMSWATEVPARSLRRGGELWVARGADSTRLSVPPVRAPSDASPQRARLVDVPSAVDGERVVAGRSEPGGPLRWFLLAGTPVEVTGRAGDLTRVRLDGSTEAWVRTTDVRIDPAPTTTAASAPVLGEVSLIASSEGVDLVLPLPEPAPFLVEPVGNSLVLTVHGVTSAGGGSVASVDPLVRRVRRARQSGDRVRFTVELAGPVFGYGMVWQDGALVLRIRRPPLVDRDSPLRGLTIAVDPGHPPLGATGPTGLTEAEATLQIARRLQRLLERRGARVVLTRTTSEPVRLGERPIVARRADAHALVSIHLNAFGEGKDPFEERGTSTFYYYRHAEPLARSIHRGLLQNMGLRDQGVSTSSLELTRVTWMPAVLCEGAFLTVPEQEAALRTAPFQEAYARGIVEGLEEYFASLRGP